MAPKPRRVTTRGMAGEPWPLAPSSRPPRTRSAASLGAVSTAASGPTGSLLSTAGGRDASGASAAERTVPLSASPAGDGGSVETAPPSREGSANRRPGRTRTEVDVSARPGCAPCVRPTSSATGCSSPASGAEIDCPDTGVAIPMVVSAAAPSAPGSGDSPANTGTSTAEGAFSASPEETGASGIATSLPPLSSELAGAATAGESGLGTTAGGTLAVGPGGGAGAPCGTGAGGQTGAGEGGVTAVGTAAGTGAAGGLAGGLTAVGTGAGAATGTGGGGETGLVAGGAGGWTGEAGGGGVAGTGGGGAETTGTDGGEGAGAAAGGDGATPVGTCTGRGSRKRSGST